MKTKNQSLSGTTTSRSSLSYIEQLITGATQEGLFYVYVPATYIDDEMATTLRSNGFVVEKKNNFLGENYDYFINWGGLEPTPTPSPAPPSSTPTPTPTKTPTPTITSTPTPSPTITPTITPTPTPSSTPIPDVFVILKSCCDNQQIEASVPGQWYLDNGIGLSTAIDGCCYYIESEGGSGNQYFDGSEFIYSGCIDCLSTYNCECVIITAVACEDESCSHCTGLEGSIEIQINYPCGTDPSSLIGQTISYNTGGSKYCCYEITNVNTECNGSDVKSYIGPYTDCQRCVENNGCHL